MDPEHSAKIEFGGRLAGIDKRLDIIEDRLFGNSEKTDYVFSHMNSMPECEEWERFKCLAEEIEDEERENRVRGYCREMGLDFDNASDYARAVSAAYKGGSDYFQPMAFIGRGMGDGEKAGAGVISRALMLKRDAERFRKLDERIREIDRMYNLHKNEKGADARAAAMMLDALQKFDDKVEHPLLKKKIAGSVLREMLNRKDNYKYYGFEILKDKYDGFIRSSKIARMVL